MLFRVRSLRGKKQVAALAMLAAVGLVGCSEDPGLQERVNRLQAEMQEKNRQLQEAQANLEKVKSDLKSARASANRPPATDAPPCPSFLPKDQVDGGYAAASQEMQKRVAGELRNYTVENCIEYPVVMPTDERPYRSKVVLLVRSDAGRSYRLEFPVSADPAGKWAFPNPTDVADALADSRTQNANNNATAGGPGPGATARNTPADPDRPPGQGTPSLVPGQSSAETRVIDWGDGRSTNAGTRTHRPPAADADFPSPSRAPTPARPVDKDVQIRW